MARSPLGRYAVLSHSPFQDVGVNHRASGPPPAVQDGSGAIGEIFAVFLDSGETLGIVFRIYR